jgi:hypothetical protein
VAREPVLAALIALRQRQQMRRVGPQQTPCSRIVGNTFLIPMSDAANGPLMASNSRDGGSEMKHPANGLKKYADAGVNLPTDCF